MAQTQPDAPQLAVGRSGKSAQGLTRSIQRATPLAQKTIRLARRMDLAQARKPERSIC
jgi:hypothetical protein